MICENCGKEHNGLYGSGRFCSKECARSFSTKYIKNKKKTTNCIECGKEIEIGLRADVSKCRCKECSEQHTKHRHAGYIKQKYNNICLICGNELNDLGKCNNDICKKFTYIQVKNIVNTFKGDFSKIGTNEIFDELNKIRKLLYHLYWVEEMSSIDIAKYFDYDRKHCIIQEFFKYLNIPKRTLKEAGNIASLQGKLVSRGGLNQYKCSWHTTWDGNEVYFRSSYELDFAKELDERKIHYEVENLRIKYFDTQRNEYRCAIPDFYIPETNTIYEIKSCWTTDIQNLIDKEQEYKKLGYNYILVFEHTEYCSVSEINTEKFKIDINKNKIENIKIYKQREGYRWIYKNNIQQRCSKKDVDKYIANGWKIGRIK